MVEFGVQIRGLVFQGLTYVIVYISLTFRVLDVLVGSLTYDMILYKFIYF